MNKKTQEEKPFEFRPDHPVFREKLHRLAVGLRDKDVDKISEIKEYFAAYNIQIAYNEQIGKIRMIAFDPVAGRGSVPVDFVLNDFING